MVLCDNECDNKDVSWRLGHMCCNECSAVECKDKCNRNWKDCGQSLL